MKQPSKLDERTEQILLKAQNYWVWFRGLSCFGQVLPVVLSLILFVALSFHIYFELSGTTCEPVCIKGEDCTSTTQCKRNSFSWEKMIEALASSSAHNLNLLLIASIGWFFFYWRARSADHDAKTAKQNAVTAEKGLTTERLTRAINQLASDKQSICIGGIRSLEQIALSHEEECMKIIQTLVARIIEISSQQHLSKRLRGRHNHLDAEIAIITLSNITKPLGNQKKSLCILANIDLESLHFEQIDLSHFSLVNTNLTAVNFKGVNFTDTKLSESIIDDATFEDCRDLTRKQIMSAKWKKGRSPRGLPKRWNLPQENPTKGNVPQDLLKLSKG
ncbi:MAG: pentapeptide repeat-containing protein [Hyphomicrobiales bacterium]|nr:pentapeptide repeat-containing protein [Hyphomicrobiales bacterium]